MECGLSSVRLLGLTDGPDALPKALAEALISRNAEGERERERVGGSAGELEPKRL